MLDADDIPDTATLASKSAGGAPTGECAGPVLGVWGWSLLSGLFLVLAACLVGVEANLVRAIAHRLADFAR